MKTRRNGRPSHVLRRSAHLPWCSMGGARLARLAGGLAEKLAQMIIDAQTAEITTMTSLVASFQ
jgi:hypothetical protein